MSKYKTIEWSYATSGNATRFGFGRSGCWSVELTDRINPPKAIKGFQTMVDAVRFALTLPHEWSPLFVQFNRDTCQMFGIALPNSGQSGAGKGGE